MSNTWQLAKFRRVLFRDLRGRRWRWKKGSEQNIGTDGHKNTLGTEKQHSLEKQHRYVLDERKLARY